MDTGTSMDKLYEQAQRTCLQRSRHDWAPDACLLEAEAGRDEHDGHFEIRRLDVLGAVGSTRRVAAPRPSRLRTLTGRTRLSGGRMLLDEDPAPDLAVVADLPSPRWHLDVNGRDQAGRENVLSGVGRPQRTSRCCCARSTRRVFAGGWK